MQLDAALSAQESLRTSAEESSRLSLEVAELRSTLAALSSQRPQSPVTSLRLSPVADTTISLHTDGGIVQFDGGVHIGGPSAGPYSAEDHVLRLQRVLAATVSELEKRGATVAELERKLRAVRCVMLCTCSWCWFVRVFCVIL